MAQYVEAGPEIVHFWDPRTGTEVPVPVNLAAEFCGAAFHLDLLYKDLRHIPGQLLDHIDSVWTASPWIRWLMGILMSLVFTHNLVICIVKAFSPVANAVAIAVSVPSLGFSATIAWHLYRWSALTNETRR